MQKRFRWFSMSLKRIPAWKMNKLQTAGLCGCAHVVLEAGSTPLPAGYCPATDLAVSAVIRQRQATASWTPAAPSVCRLSGGSNNECEKQGSYPPIHWNLKDNESLNPNWSSQYLALCWLTLALSLSRIFLSQMHVHLLIRELLLGLCVDIKSC